MEEYIDHIYNEDCIAGMGRLPDHLSHSGKPHQKITRVLLNNAAVMECTVAHMPTTPHEAEPVLLKLFWQPEQTARTRQLGCCRAFI
ncbi:MAG TPA: hypothetical protein DHW78_07210 [Ruminococcaceae bacterium]|jgi:hypothetical protein|nr:hypothetical protein [Oscillospiraceae bacterium]HCM24093.1 hypothetical protein [Oscillospiraceae bacterium]